MDHNNELQRRSWRLWRWLYRTRRDRLHKTIVLLEAAVDLTRADWTRTIQLEPRDDGVFHGPICASPACPMGFFTSGIGGMRNIYLICRPIGMQRRLSTQVSRTRWVLPMTRRGNSRRIRSSRFWLFRAESGPLTAEPIDEQFTDEELAEFSFQGFRDRVIRLSGKKNPTVRDTTAGWLTIAARTRAASGA